MLASLNWNYSRERWELSPLDTDDVLQVTPDQAVVLGKIPMKVSIASVTVTLDDGGRIIKMTGYESGHLVDLSADEPGNPAPWTWKAVAPC